MRLRSLSLALLLFPFLYVGCSAPLLIPTKTYTFEYILTSPSLVTINIGHSGQISRDLFQHKVQDAGRHQGIWDGRDSRGRAVQEGPHEARIQISTLRIEALDPLAPAGLLFEPTGILVTGKPDNLSYIILDAGHNRVVRLDQFLNLTQQLGAFGLGQEQLTQPMDMALDANLVVSICDVGNQRIQRYDHRGQYLSSIEILRKQHGITEIPEKMEDPQGIAFDGYGHFLISDAGRDRLVALDDSSLILWEAGGYGRGEGQLFDPRGICVDSEGQIYVADQGNSRISVFDDSGHFLRTISSFILGDKELEIRSPQSLLFTSHGLLLVTDTSLNRILIGDTQGRLLAEIPGLEEPMGLTFHEDILYIADSSRNEIARYRFVFETQEIIKEIR